MIVPAEMNEVLRPVQPDGGERAEIHPERAVAVEDEHFAPGQRDGQTKSDRRAETEGFDLDVAIARAHRVPLGGGAAGRANEQLVFDQRSDGLEAFKALHTSILESFPILRKFSRLRRGTVPHPERGLSPFCYSTARVSSNATGRLELLASVTAPVISCFTLAGSRMTMCLMPNPCSTGSVTRPTM